ncbi:ribosome biogenesis GTPase Der [bacterium]|nr:ribosome biogenesis GTPase Der [FCB group bacterium]MBL7192053.1 ribosome biogenesis GTPase Der [bacterium]
MSDKPIVAIIGRPNVGKSTLFNRMIGRRQAVTAEESGITRDRSYADCEWTGRQFTLIDTGGIMLSPKQPLEWGIKKQAETAVSEADKIVLMLDTKTGLIPEDISIVEFLRKSGKPVILCANKADNDKAELEAHEFSQIGLGVPMAVSALRGRGVGDLLDRIVEGFAVSDDDTKDDSVKIAVIGRPNVGKSSLVNAYLGEERHLVDDNPGTTRDSIDSKIRFYNTDITLIDTAGLRRASRVNDAVEFFCNLRTARALNRCDVALVLFEAPENLSSQDIRIINEAVDKGKGIVLLANKWDLLEKQTGTFEKFRREVYYRIPNLNYIPLLTISAVDKQRIHKTLETALTVLNFARTRIPTPELNDYLLPVIQAQPPPAVKGKFINIKYTAQVDFSPITFAVFSNYPQYIQKPYRRFIENRIRARYPFTGVPVKIHFRRK